MSHLKFSFLLILIASLLVLNGANVKSNEATNPPASPTTSKQKEKPQEKTTDPQPIKAPDVRVNPAANKKENGTKNETQQSYDIFWPPNWSDWVLIVVAAGAACIALRTLRAIKRQAEIAAEGVQVSRIAAEAAQKSADVADKSLTLLERAWLNVAFHGPYVPVPESHDIFYDITNTGKSPAKIKMRVVNIKIRKSLTDIEITDIPSGELPTERIIFANERVLNIIKTTLIPQETVENIKNGTSLLIIHGFVLYDDIFNIRHITRFCYTYKPGISDFVMPYDSKPEYNAAD